MISTPEIEYFPVSQTYKHKSKDLEFYACRAGCLRPLRLYDKILKEKHSCASVKQVVDCVLSKQM